jgi:transcriptional regulator with XRE-family HTH domain
VTEAELQGVVRDLAQRIRCARLAIDLTQEEVAERSRIPYKRYQAVELGAANLTVKTLARLADALGLTIATLTGFSLPPPEASQPQRRVRKPK